ncbi:hypothetical protein D1007_03601 [Hordeum vulgare]|nr:hypothetical protein D1007_03601 [Hordeum vulgare]
MEPTEILNVRFHLGGEFIRIGQKLDYVGGDEEYSEIERDKLSLQEVKSYLKDHVQLKESMKNYFLIPRKALTNGLVFLNDDMKCVEMTDSEDVVLIPDDKGVITEIISSPVKHSRARRHPVATDIDEPIFSQLCNPSQAFVSDAMPQTADVSPILVASQQPLMSAPAAESEDSDSDPEYMPHCENSGEGSEVIELRRHARKFKKMKDTNTWIGRDLTEAVPINLIANMEGELVGDEKDSNYDSLDEDYSYSEDSDGKSVRRKSRFPRYKNDMEIPKFELLMVFRSKNQLVKALRR